MKEKQFILSYYGNVSREDSSNMTPFELDMWVDFLKKRKELEVEQAQRNS